MSIAEELTGQKRAPSALDERAKEQLRTRTVELLLDLRIGYLRSPSGNALKVREILPNRSKAALRTCQNPAEWATRVAQNLGVRAWDSSASRALIDLVDYVEGNDLRAAWRDLFAREMGYWFALVWRTAEVRAEERKAARDAEKGSE